MKTLEDHKELDAIVDAIQSELPIFRNGETYLPLQVLDCQKTRWFLDLKKKIM